MTNGASDRDNTVVGADLGIHEVLRSWSADRFGGRLPVPASARVDLAWLLFCADEHVVAVHCPHDPSTVLAYTSFVRETREQFLLFRRAGYVIELWPGLGEP